MKLEQVLPELRNGGHISNSVYTSPSQKEGDDPILNSYIKLQEAEFDGETFPSLVQVSRGGIVNNWSLGNLPNNIVFGDDWFTVNKKSAKKGVK